MRRWTSRFHFRTPFLLVIPAKAGIQLSSGLTSSLFEPRSRGE
jgi:hypothetical protein